MSTSISRESAWQFTGIDFPDRQLELEPDLAVCILLVEKGVKCVELINFTEQHSGELEVLIERDVMQTLLGTYVDKNILHHIVYVNK